MLVFVVGLWNYVNSRCCHDDDDDDDDADDDDDDEADDDSDTAILVQTWTVALALSRTHKRSQFCSRWQTDLPRRAFIAQWVQHAPLPHAPSVLPQPTIASLLKAGPNPSLVETGVAQSALKVTGKRLGPSCSIATAFTMMN